MKATKYLPTTEKAPIGPIADSENLIQMKAKPFVKTERTLHIARVRHYPEPLKPIETIKESSSEEDDDSSYVSPSISISEPPMKERNKPAEEEKIGVLNFSEDSPLPNNRINR